VSQEAVAAARRFVTAFNEGIIPAIKETVPATLAHTLTATREAGHGSE